MTDRDHWTLDAMVKLGGSFVSALGEAGLRADAINLQLIKKTWPEYWKQYEVMGRKLKKEDSE